MDVREQVVGPRDDFMQFLLQLREKKQLSLMHVTAHTTTFFLDGYETTSIVIGHALHQLARTKRAQEKLRAEINSAEQISFEKLNELPYLEMVLNGMILISTWVPV